MPELDDKRQSIIADLSNGLTRECACARAGITSQTLGKWLSRGKKDEEPLASFLSEVKKAERSAEAEMVQRIRDASVSNWQAAAWWLERMNPESWYFDRDMMKELKKLVRERKRERASAKSDASCRRNDVFDD